MKVETGNVGSWAKQKICSLSGFNAFSASCTSFSKGNYGQLLVQFSEGTLRAITALASLFLVSLVLFEGPAVGYNFYLASRVDANLRADNIAGAMSYAGLQHSNCHQNESLYGKISSYCVKKNNLNCVLQVVEGVSWKGDVGQNAKVDILSQAAKQYVDQNNAEGAFQLLKKISWNKISEYDFWTEHRKETLIKELFTNCLEKDNVECAFQAAELAPALGSHAQSYRYQDLFRYCLAAKDVECSQKAFAKIPSDLFSGIRGHRLNDLCLEKLNRECVDPVTGRQKTSFSSFFSSIFDFLVRNIQKPSGNRFRSRYGFATRPTVNPSKIANEFKGLGLDIKVLKNKVAVAFKNKVAVGRSDSKIDRACAKFLRSFHPDRSEQTSSFWADLKYKCLEYIKY